MRKLTVAEFVSLDGVMEAPGGEPEYPHTGWVFDFSSDEQEQYKLQELLEAETLLLGRKTYEGFSEAWTKRSGEFADKFNSMEKYVVSSTLENPEWNNTTVIGIDDVPRLREGDGGPIMVNGSCMLAQHLLDQDLVDELRVMIFPVILRSGKRLYPEGAEKTVLKLAGTQTFDSGVTAQVYERA